MLDLEAVHKSQRHRKRIHELERCKTDLYYLCTAYLGYTLLDPEWHRARCERADELRDHQRVLRLWPRKYYKTTILTIAEAIQDILIDPLCTTLMCHAVEDMVKRMVLETGHHLIRNKKLRSLEPIGYDDETGTFYNVLPSPKRKRWINQSGGGNFTLPVRDLSDPRCREEVVTQYATVLGAAAGTEITGFHAGPDTQKPPRSHYDPAGYGGLMRRFMSEAVGGVRLDDIIGYKTLEESTGLAKIDSWWSSTCVPVLNRNARVRAVGTRWHQDDRWGKFAASKEWETEVFAMLDQSQKDHPDAIEVQGYRGTPVFYSAKEVRRLASSEEMGPDFPSQGMNDPTPAGEMPWNKELCEHTIEGKDAQGVGFVVVISDPAPAKVGSEDFVQKDKNPEKNFWAHIVVKMRRRGDRTEIILLDGAASREWDTDKGWTELCRLMRKWNTRHAAVEATGQAIALYMADLKRIAKVEGVRLNLIDLTLTYRGKNPRFESYASRAKSEEVMMSTTLPGEFRDRLLFQCRRWRPIGKGNSLKLDDHADVASYSVDPVFRGYTPRVEDETVKPFSPYRPHKRENDYRWGTRHIRA